MKDIHKSASRFLHLYLLSLSGIMLISAVQPVKIYAQELRIASGTYFMNNGVTVVANGAKIANLGTIGNAATGSIKLAGNWQNDGIYTGASGSGVTLNGSSAQTIGGTSITTFSNLTLNNSLGFTLLNNINVNGILDFQGGLLTTGTYTATIGTAGSIIGASATTYVNGKLAMTYGVAASKQFPIGKGGNYRPLSLRYLTSLTGTSVVTAEQFESGLTGPLPAGVTLLTTNRSWTITQTGGSNLQYFLTLDPNGYTPTQTVVMLKQDAGVIASYATTTPNYTNTEALATFSDFALGEAPGGYSITGNFTYNNSANTPLDSVWVVLKQNSARLDSVRTTLAGTYTFNPKPNGAYTISARTTKPWASVNATDAIKVQRHFAGLEILTEPVKRLAGDVNLSNSINATDAIKIKRRFSGLDNSFTRGDWTFAKQTTGGDTIIVSSSAVTQNFYGLVVGDVNGSNIPGPGAKSQGILALEQSKTIKASPGDEIEIPVRVSSEASIGAISMVVGYPGQLMKVNEIKTQHGTPYYTTNNDALRMAWSETTPLTLGKDQAMMSLKVKISDQFSKDDQIRLSLNQESEIANIEGRVFDNLILTAPTIIYKNSNGVEEQNLAAKFEVYPVPNNGEFTAEITSADQKTFAIQIYNKLGQVIHEIKDINVKGKSCKKFNLKYLPSGSYTVILRSDAGFIARKILIKY